MHIATNGFYKGASRSFAEMMIAEISTVVQELSTAQDHIHLNVLVHVLSCDFYSPGALSIKSAPHETNLALRNNQPNIRAQHTFKAFTRQAYLLRCPARPLGASRQAPQAGQPAYLWRYCSLV